MPAGQLLPGVDEMEEMDMDQREHTFNNESYIDGGSRSAGGHNDSSQAPGGSGGGGRQHYSR